MSIMDQAKKLVSSEAGPPDVPRNELRVEADLASGTAGASVNRTQGGWEWGAYFKAVLVGKKNIGAGVAISRKF